MHKCVKFASNKTARAYNSGRTFCVSYCARYCCCVSGPWGLWRLDHAWNFSDEASNVLVWWRSNCMCSQRRDTTAWRCGLQRLWILILQGPDLSLHRNEYTSNDCFNYLPINNLTRSGYKDSILHELCGRFKGNRKLVQLSEGRIPWCVTTCKKLFWSASYNLLISPL